MKSRIVHILICASFFGVVILGALTISPPAVFADDMMVICNDSVSIDSLEKKDVKNIFLGRKTRWADGDKINFVTLKSGPVHDLFLKLYVGKTLSQYNNYWKKRAFTGKGKVPKSFATPEELIGYVVKTRGAIGYIPFSAYQNQIKSISIN